MATKLVDRTMASFSSATVSGFDKGLIGFVIFVAIATVVITIVYVNMRVKRNQINECNAGVATFNALLSTIQGTPATPPPPAAK